MSARTDPQLATPRYRQIVDDVLEMIRSGQRRPGARLPTENELMRQYEVSRTTVSRAMRDLEMQGFVIRKRGSGTYVADRSTAVERLHLALFVPWIETVSGLPHVEGLIHQHVAELAGRSGSTLALHFPPPGAATWEQRVLMTTDDLIDNGVDGVLYYPAEVPAQKMVINQQVVDRFVAADVPLVLIDRDIVARPQRSRFTRIGYDNRRGGILLTDHLINLGCRRIAFVGIPGVSTVVSNRISGYYEAHRLQGLEVDPDLVCRADESQLTAEFCRQLIEQHRPDAIIGKMDRYAALIGRHLMGMGMKIGIDIKLAGFDDDPIAELLPVPLTTIRLPVQAFARAAYDAIRRCAADPSADVTQVVIDTELIVRGSTVGSFIEGERRGARSELG